MRTLVALAVAAALLVGLTGVAVAAPPPGSASAGDPSKPPTTGAQVPPTSAGSTAIGGKPPTPSTTPPNMTGRTGSGGKAPDVISEPRGQRRMVGEVASVDATHGRILVKTADGDVDLHLPPTALQGIKPGDRVEIQLGLARTGLATGRGAGTPKSP